MYIHGFLVYLYKIIDNYINLNTIVSFNISINISDICNITITNKSSSSSSYSCDTHAREIYILSDISAH